MPNYKKIHHSRARFLAGVIVVMMAIFIARLFYIQVIRHDHYLALADTEQTRQWVLPSVRGEIYVMNKGTPSKLVLNETVYTVWADPKVVEEPEKVMQVLKKVAGGNLLNSAEASLKKTKTRYQVLAKKITHKQAQLIKKQKLLGIGFERGERRVYPEGELASQVLGFVNDEGKGQYGVEGGLNAQLSGKDGLIKTVTDVRDVPLTIGNENINIPAQDGKNIVLSLDRGIQARAEESLKRGIKKIGAQKGSLVVMNPKNGQVLAMANYPSYDPTNVNQLKDISLLNNQTISAPYEAGSVIKTFTVATGIDRGVITPQSTFVNTDRVRIGDYVIGNATSTYKGTRSMQFALDKSLNTGMVTVAKRLGGGSINNSRNIIYSYFTNKFHLGRLTGIELAGESPGTIISPNNPEGNAIRYANMTFGQGMDVTMLQVSAGFCSLVNGGIYHKPTIVAGEINQFGDYVPADRTNSSRVLSEVSANTVRDMVHRAHYATYQTNKIENSRYYLGGKTGTSQTIDKKTGKYTSEQTTGNYLGFGGEKYKTPEYVIMVQVSGKGMNLTGGAHAKPIFNDLSNKLNRYLKLKPKG
ncbi:hypothetical protein CR956_00425 [Candidatus Saccharibacteria bacterium]|nr:MAG: hypothetical protein CR956_00425 [Candidatus Saccharibacteria bacterium]